MKQCPKCNIEFNEIGKWGLKKFCSQSCANSREQTSEMREKKRLKLQKVGICKFCKQECGSMGALKQHETSCDFNPNKLPGPFFGKSHADNTKKKQGQNNIMGQRIPESLLDMSKRTVSKVLHRLNVGCSNCGWKESSCDIHHILPVSKGGTDTNTNLTILCPNCHRLAHTNKLDKFTSVADQIGELWREHYYAHK